jgi:hypothetical protein
MPAVISVNIIYNILMLYVNKCCLINVTRRYIFCHILEIRSALAMQVLLYPMAVNKYMEQSPTANCNVSIRFKVYVLL